MTPGKIFQLHLEDLVQDYPLPFEFFRHVREVGWLVTEIVWRPLLTPPPPPLPARRVSRHTPGVMLNSLRTRPWGVFDVSPEKNILRSA